MVDRIKRRFDLHPQRLTGDSVYGAGRLLKWLVDCKITPHVPRSAREMNLKPGQAAAALIKATEVMILRV